MDTTTFDTNTLTLLVAILGSTLTMVILMYRLFGRLDTKFDTKIGRLDTKFDTKIDALDTKFDTKFDRLGTRVTGLENRFTALDAKVEALDAKVGVLGTQVEAMAGDVADTRERVARIEGHLMAPGTFTTRGLGPAAPDEPQPGDSGADPDHRQAG